MMDPDSMPKEWWNDEEWWSSKGYKDFAIDIYDPYGKKKMTTKEDIDKFQQIYNKWRGVGSSPAPSGGAGGISGSSNGGAGAAGAVIGSVSSNTVSFDERAKINILEVKDTLKRHCTLQHLPKNSVIAGGVFVSLFHKEEINDIDVFILGSKDYDQITLPELNKPGKYSTMKNFKNYTGRDDIIAIFNDTETKFQYIYTRVETPKELLEGFDYLHCCCAYYDDKLWINPRIYDAIINKWLIPNNLNNIRDSRKSKFFERGFQEPRELLKMYNPPWTP